MNEATKTNLPPSLYSFTSSSNSDLFLQSLPLPVMDSDSDPLFPFNVFPPTPFLPSASASASDSTVAGQISRRKTAKFIKRTNDRLLAPSTSGAAIAKPKYGKKPDPTAPKITRPCSECGKKFWSWKALFGHMRCHPERQWRGINPPPNFRRSSSSVESESTEEDHEIAACLIMLANGPVAIDRTETDDECRRIQESETTAAAALDRFVECAGPPSCRFECSSCKKVFGSRQALGGHRASHKNVKGCFAVARTDDGGGTAEECSVCMKVHKRRQWEKDEDHHHHHHRPYSSVGIKGEGSGGYLDLNLPPPMADIEESSSSYSSGIVLDLRLGLN